jgi:hypothetical protein
MLNAHDLAVDSKKIHLKEAEYSSDQQTRFNVISEALSVTYNGTQTYDANGRPRDADNDN